MPCLDVGGRLLTPSRRIDLAADVIGVMVHAKDKTGMRRRRVALAETLLGMSDRYDEPEARAQVKEWFRQAGGFKTASESDPYNVQQNDFIRQIPRMLTVGIALDLVWAMDAHHRATLSGGASLNKAFAVIRDSISGRSVSERTLRSSWSRYRPVAPLCAVFALAYQEAMRDGGPHELHTRLTYAFDEQLHLTLGLAAAYQHFATRFKPHGQKQSLLDRDKIWLLRGIDPDESFVPPPLPRDVLRVAEAYEAPRNKSYDCR